MGNAGFSVIGFSDGDLGSHCNACQNVAKFKITLNRVSVRVCESCALELFEQSKTLLYRKYTTARIAELEARLKEAEKIIEFVAYEDMQIIEKGYEAEKMAAYYLDKYSQEESPDPIP